ncbi:hypothetical protein [Streptomyces sp. NPDC056255]|uniref:hypothetical protein n=1 Tax=Streptomyces sp. NPDC056255 TaxID=3345764 RepID=UPI0035DC4F03
MGYLRKKSFMIFHDPDAPDQETTDDPKKVAEIEAAHEAGKKDRIDALITKALKQPVKQNYNLAIEIPEGAAPMDDSPAPAAVTEPLLRDIVEKVQDIRADEQALKDFINGTFRAGNEKNIRDFAWAVFEVQNSKADLAAERYRPRRRPLGTVRFKDGERFGTNEWVNPLYVLQGETLTAAAARASREQQPTLWVKVADGGWEEDGNWGGYLQIANAGALKGSWLDSTDGWVTSQKSKDDGITFYDVGPYYEIWQGTRENGRPMIIEKDCLRFVEGATPDRFQVEDATWE